MLIYGYFKMSVAYRLSSYGQNLCLPNFVLYLVKILAQDRCSIMLVKLLNE